KGNLEIENDEQNRDEVEADIELAARIVERIEAALVGRKLFRIRVLPSEQQGRPHRRSGNADSNPEEDEDRQIFEKQRFQNLPVLKPHIHSTFIRRTAPMNATLRPGQSRRHNKAPVASGKGKKVAAGWLRSGASVPSTAASG